MRYTQLLALLSAPLLTLAQSGPNAFKVPEEGLSATGGEPLELNWTPTTDGTVTLVLRSGSSTDLNEGTVIADGIDNSGSYTWTPSNSLTRGSDYTVEIVDDSDPSNVNYTPYFVLDTDTTTAAQTSVVSLGQPTSTPELSTASPTGAATSVTKPVSAVVSSAAEESTGMSSGDSTMATMTASGSMAMSSGASNTAAFSMPASSASSGASASSDLNAPEQSGNAGSRTTAMVGVVGAVALGALAL